MKRISRFIVKLIIVFISFLLVDGGRTFIFAGINIHHILDHKHNRDIETPNHVSLVKLDDTEKWIESQNAGINSAGTRNVDIINVRNLESQGFLKSIWQPPKAS